MVLISLLTASLAFAAVRAQSNQKCYYMANMESSYAPCTTNTTSSCCLPGDICLEHGACYSPSTKVTYIAGCTDPSYRDPLCGAQNCNKGIVRSFRFQNDLLINIQTPNLLGWHCAAIIGPAATV